MIINFTIGQLIAGILALCGGIITVAGAIGAIANWVKTVKAPEKAQNERIASLEEKVARHDQLFTKDNQRLETIEEGNRITQEALLALLSHGIDGNDIESMKKAKKDLHEFLIRGRS